jgi:hypothetical protein
MNTNTIVLEELRKGKMLDIKSINNSEISHKLKF